MEINRCRIWILFMLFTIMCAGTSRAQSRKTSDWIDYGSSHISKWMQVAPGKLGPNALPVPEMDYALVGTSSFIETGAHVNVMKGDTSISSYLAFLWQVVPEKVAVKAWGNPTETFRTDNLVRDNRQIYYDDTGWMTTGGDLWISTFIQLLKNMEKLPDFSLNYSFKTTTGSILHGRFTDAPAHYFYLAAGKSFYPRNSLLDEVRIAGMGGFYVWQTNKVEMAQDEGPIVQLGMIFRLRNYFLYNETGGYNGYGAYSYMGVKGFNNPVIYRARLLREGNRIDWRFEYKTGWSDYNYSTFKFDFVYKFN